jgi:hypothetical protein
MQRSFQKLLFARLPESIKKSLGLHPSGSRRQEVKKRDMQIQW